MAAAAAEDQTAGGDAPVFACPKCNKLTDASKPNCTHCDCDLRGLSADSDTFPRMRSSEPLAPDDRWRESKDLGRIINGRYLVHEKLGEGGMGAVFRVEHLHMGKTMALKLLRPDGTRKKGAVERFRREAQTVAKLDHPNIVTVFDSGEDEGALYLVMEYVQGLDLAALVKTGGPLPEKRAIALTIQVLRALACAHQADIIHRDIKPGNVMVARGSDERDRVKVLDFGLAKFVSGEREGDAVQVTGGAEIVGTPNCMSPEQARGQPLDSRSDLYSATALLFELLTGRGPFVGVSPFEVVSHHLVSPPPTLKQAYPEVSFSDAIEAVVARGLKKDPAERFQTAEEMTAALEQALGGSVTLIPTSSTSASLTRPPEIARREDWDAFEQSFKVRRTAVRIGVVLALAGTVAAGAHFRGELAAHAPAQVVRSEEQEPNDSPSIANLIEPNKPIAGHIGHGLRQGISDRDWFKFAVREKSAVALEVTGVRGVNLVMEVFAEPAPGTTEARLVTVVDDGTVSEREELNDLVLAPGGYFVRLSDKPHYDEPPGLPRENLQDAYMLQLRIDPLRLFQELEPDNEPSAPMAVEVKSPVLGKSGIPGPGDVVRAGLAPLPPWSEDYYLLPPQEGAQTACALLGGARHATLRLAMLTSRGKDKGYKTSNASKVSDAGAVGACATKPASTSSLFQVRLEAGNTQDATYPLAFVTDQPDGFEGLFALVDWLVRANRSDEARALLDRALALVPQSPQASKAKTLAATL